MMMLLCCICCMLRTTCADLPDIPCGVLLQDLISALISGIGTAVEGGLQKSSKLMQLLNVLVAQYGQQLDQQQLQGGHHAATCSSSFMGKAVLRSVANLQ